MEYLITDAQVRMLRQGFPPVTVQKVLSALPCVKQVSVNDDKRFEEVSIWSTLFLNLPGMLNVRPGSWFERACFRIYKIAHQITLFLVVMGVISGCIWGYDYIQAHWDSSLTPAMGATIAALLVPAIGAALILIKIVQVIRTSRENGSAPALSGFLITELQVLEILRSSPPGYAIAILNSLPVMAYFELTEALPEGAEGVPSSNAPESVGPEKWWKIPVGVFACASLIWLSLGVVLSDSPNTLDVLGSFAVFGLVVDAVFYRFWRVREKRTIAERSGTTW